MTYSALFAQIEALVPTLGGWATPEKCCDFASIILSTHPIVSTELGTWMGRGAISMALAHRFVGKGKVWVVDPWSAQASAVDMEGANAEWWGEQAKHEVAYRAFCDSVRTLQLEEWMHIQRKTSDEADRPEAVNFCVIDGNHGPQAVKDVERWAPKVVAGGTVYLDDLGWTGGAVAAAGQRLLEMGFVPLFEQDQGVFYQRAR